MPVPGAQALQPAATKRMFIIMNRRTKIVVAVIGALTLGAGSALAAPTVLAAVEDGYVSYFLARTLTAFGCF